MGSIAKWIIAIPVAAFLTFALFVLMMILIAGDWVPQEKNKTAKFEINPTVEDIKVVQREQKIDKVKKVVTPPPPPQIERQQANQPSEPIASLEGAIPDFEPPRLERDSFKIAVSDRDAQPLVRIPAVMPPRAEKSGHCKVQFDVSPEGAPFNVVATYCSQSLFKRPSTKSVQKWKYNPKMQDGRAVARTGVVSQITFRLQDERGRDIPE